MFWVLAGVTLMSAGATITFRSPVYCAVWFALSLLGTAGLFLVQGAQFLAVATIVVYAGSDSGDVSVRARCWPNRAAAPFTIGSLGSH